MLDLNYGAAPEVGSGSQPEVAFHGLMSAPASCGHNLANAYRRLVPIPDSNGAPGHSAIRFPYSQY